MLIWNQFYALFRCSLVPYRFGRILNDRRAQRLTIRIRWWYFSFSTTKKNQNLNCAVCNRSCMYIVRKVERTSILFDSIQFQHIGNKRPNECELHNKQKTRNIIDDCSNPHQLSIMPIFNYRVIVVLCPGIFNNTFIYWRKSLFTPHSAHMHCDRIDGIVRVCWMYPNYTPTSNKYGASEQQQTPYKK